MRTVVISGKKMGLLMITKVTVILIAFTSLFAVSQAACSLCPFQWSEHQHHCYRYFPSLLSYDQAEDYCRRQNARRFSGGLTAIGSLDEMVFIMKQVAEIINVTSQPDIPKYIWLDKADRERENNSLIYYNALSANNETDANFTSCSTSSSAIAATLSELGTGSSSMVPAPEVVEHKCAVYAGEGAYIDLGDFAGTCLSDPDLCVSETVTWSLWVKINSRLALNHTSYFLCTGGYTFRARGIFFNYQADTDTFKFGARSLRKSWTINLLFARSRIPMDTWFHLAATVDLKQANAELLVYLDGVLLAEDSIQSSAVSTSDLCTKLILGTRTPCPDVLPSSSTYGGSAAYSNLMVFDQLLTPGQIGDLYSCGSLDSGLKVRSLYLDHTYTYSGNLRYVCKASASTGPTIYWRVYHADQAQWEDMDPSTGAGVDITPTSFSTCVVQSVLVIDQSRGPSSEGDIISCTASSDSLNASVYIHLGELVTFGYSDHDNGGLFIAQSGHYYHQSGIATGIDDDGDLGTYPFICEKESRGYN